MFKETYTVELFYCLDDSTDGQRFRTTVTIDDEDPITEVSDIARDRLYDKYPGRQVIVIDEIMG